MLFASLNKIFSSFLEHMKFLVDGCMNAVLEDTQLSGNVMFVYSSVIVSSVLTETDLRRGSSSKLSMPLNSAFHLFTMLFECGWLHECGPRMPTMSPWISLCETEVADDLTIAFY